jgi:hypothetical protein
MKKIILTLAFALTAAITAQAQPVYSNVVGMVKMTAFRGAYTQVASNFVFENGSVTVADFFGNSLPPLSSVFFWSTQNGGEYLTATYGTRGWSNGTLEIDRAKGFIISIPNDAPQASYDIVFNGSVPSATAEASIDTVLIPGFNLIGMPYVVPVSLSEANFQASNLDQVLLWDGTSWQTSTFGTRGGWSTDFTIEPGQAFFYKSNLLNPKTWTLSNPVNLN